MEHRGDIRGLSDQMRAEKEDVERVREEQVRARWLTAEQVRVGNRWRDKKGESGMGENRTGESKVGESGMGAKQVKVEQVRMDWVGAKGQNG